MNDLAPSHLEHAIRHRFQVEFSYDRQPRIVQPAALGLHYMTGIMSLRAYQVGGRTNSRPPPFWTVFIVDRITDLSITDAVFPRDPPGHDSQGRHLHPVIVEL